MTDRQPAVAAAEPARPPNIWRAVLFSVVVAPFHTYWLIHLEIVRGTGFASTVSLFFNVILTLVVLVALNVPLRRYLPRHALTRPELVTVYIMLSLVTCLCSIDMMKPLICLMPWAREYATAENRWEQLFFRQLPQQWIVQDPVAVRAYYEGGTSFYRPEFLGAWLQPVLLWVAFIVALTWVMLCLNVLIRRRWMDHERLTYPIALLPFELTEPTGAFYRQRMMWLGFAVAGAYDLLNGLHSLWPVIPALNLQNFYLHPYLRSAPWNAIGWTPLTLFPFVVGMGYLLPIELLMSFWVFFGVWKLESVAAKSLGLPLGRHQWPFFDEQALGCYLAIVAFALFAMRGHLREVLRECLSGRSDVAPGDPFSYRTAFWGALIGCGVLVAFLLQAGMPLWSAIAFFVLYYLIALCITRMRAQFGPPVHDLHFVGPDQTLTSVLGSRAFSLRSLTALTYLYWFNRAYRSHPMPHQMETLKMCRRGEIIPRGIAIAMVVAVLVGALAHFWSYLHIAYDLGAARKMVGWGTYGYSREAFARLEGWIMAPSSPNPQMIGAILWGFVSTLALMGLQARVVWLPLHPLGYAISNGWSAHWTYSSLFVAWALKATISRYWGHKGYLNALPFFLGLILGEFVVGGLWTVVGTVTGLPTFSFWRG
ncbi:MAG: hypothetical protein FJX74_00485 [Armatimonadetes bacterium]|nr:hypothetical protein [Armatimonadota bacterium]